MSNSAKASLILSLVAKSLLALASALSCIRSSNVPLNLSELESVPTLELEFSNPKTSKTNA